MLTARFCIKQKQPQTTMKPIAPQHASVAIVPTTNPSTGKNKKESDGFLLSVKTSKPSHHGGLKIPRCDPTLIYVGGIGVGRCRNIPTEPEAIRVDRRVDGNEMGNIRNSSRITYQYPTQARMNWLVLCCAVSLLMCFSLADAELTFCTGTKCQTTKQKQDMAMAMTSSSSIPRRLLNKRLLTSTNFVYMVQDLNKQDAPYGCCGGPRYPGTQKITVLRDCQRGMFELTGHKLYAKKVTEPPSTRTVPLAPGCAFGFGDAGTSVYLNSGTGFCGGSTWVGGSIDNGPLATDNQICYNGPNCTHTDGVTANTVECMCGQSICTADEKYCGYTPSGAIGTFGTVGQCNVGVFSVLHSGQCNDPESNRWVIKDLDDCNLGSTHLGYTGSATPGHYGSQLPTGCVGQGNDVLYLQEDSSSTNCSIPYYQYNCICWNGPECSNTLGTEPIGSTPCMCGGKICGVDALPTANMYCIKKTMQCSLTPRQCLYTSGKTGNTGACTCGTGVPPVICGQVNRYCIGNLNYCGPQCNAGTYRNLINGVCDSCSAGLYNTETGQSDVSACIPCLAGTYSSAVGASLESTCQNCSPGTATTITATSVITATLT